MTESTKSYITEGIVLAAIPAAGYWAAYLYELGYCNYLQIPYQLIEIPVNAVLANALSVLGGIAVVIILFDLLRRSMEGVTEALKNTFYKLLFIYFIGFGFYLTFGRSELELRIFMAIVAGPVFVKDFLWPLWSQRHIKGYGNKVTAAKKQDFEFDSVLDQVAKKIGTGPFVAIYLMYIVSIFAYFAGGYGANMQTEFLVSGANPERILARKYGDSWVSVRIDSKTKQVFPDFEIIKVEDTAGFMLLKTGRLTPSQPAEIK